MKMNIAIDKLKHFFVATIMSFIMINIHPLGGFIFVLIVLAGKEIIWDYIMKKGHIEIMDFLYGLVPAVLILITKLI